MNPSGGFNAPTVTQPTQPTVPQRIIANGRYLMSLPGILRLSLILFQFAAWVSAAAVIKPGASTALPGDMDASRSAYLFFSIVGWILALVLFLINFFNIISLGGFNRIPWLVVTFFTDLLWLLPTFILAIVAAVRETQAKSLSSPQSDSVNIGAFGSAAFFGFLCTVIYAVDGVYHLRLILKSGVHTPPPYLP